MKVNLFEYDIENEGKKLSKETLDKIHHYKTGKLLSCAFQMGALIASPNDLEILKQIGYKIGLAFQIQDDILDVSSDDKTLCKNSVSDESNHIETYFTLLGIENYQKEANIGQGMKVPNWMKFYVTIILPIVVIFVFVNGII